MVSNNYSETVKCDEKHNKLKNQRVSIHQTRFILCWLYYRPILQHITHASIPLCYTIL